MARGLLCPAHRPTHGAAQLSAILGVFGPPGDLPDDATARGMLAAMDQRGGDWSKVWRGDGAVLAVARHAWQTDAHLAGPATVATANGIAVVTDAAIFYRDELRRKLDEQSIRPLEDTPAHLVLAAYRAWGDRCAEQLEGDFAFLVWNSHSRTALAARDFQGKRTLFHAQAGDTLLVASAISGLLAHPKCPAELNLPVIGALAAGFFSSGSETAYRGVSSVAAGATVLRRDGNTRVRRHWEPPPIDGRSPLRFEEAAEELSRLLQRAVAERLAPRGPTAVWLSGGWDSTAVFGAGEAALRARGRGEHLHAISISYPPGDPGREDELIDAVVGQWQSPITWLDIADIPMLDGLPARAAAPDEPFAHPFELWNRSLARASREADARVALDGNGGDQFFQVSNIYMGDLFRTGRWLSLAREWRAKGGRSPHFRGLFRNAIQPNLSTPLLRAATRLRGGRPLRPYLEPAVPAWFNPDFVTHSGLIERERRNTPPRREQGHAAQEMFWYLRNDYGPRVVSAVYNFALQEGVEDRSPLYDRRVVEFAASRPAAERSSGREIKRLLRRSMSGLLPAHVLAPRTHKTGTTFGYFAGELRSNGPPVFTAVLDEPLLLEEFGIVCAKELRKSYEKCVGQGYMNLGGALLSTLQAELWLRARLRPKLIVPPRQLSPDPQTGSGV